MEKGILAVIEEKAKDFSKGQMRIAKYILENYDKAAFMTAAKMGDIVGVSESTVVRFAVELGYDGYPSMRRVLQEMVCGRLTSVQRIEGSRDIMEDQDILVSVLNSDIDQISHTLEGIDKAQFERVVNAISGAKRIYIIGLRSSAGLANFMSFYFKLLFDNVIDVNEAGVNEAYENMVRISSEDVFIGISFPRYSRRTIQAMRFAGERGATVIGITDNPASPIVHISHMNLYAKSDMVSFLDSLVAPLSLINALVVAVGAKKNEGLSATFEELERIWNEYEVYETSED